MNATRTATKIELEQATLTLPLTVHAAVVAESHATVSSQLGLARPLLESTPSRRRNSSHHLSSRNPCPRPRSLAIHHHTRCLNRRCRLRIGIIKRCTLLATLDYLDLSRQTSLSQPRRTLTSSLSLHFTPSIVLPHLPSGHHLSVARLAQAHRALCQPSVNETSTSSRRRRMRRAEMMRMPRKKTAVTAEERVDPHEMERQRDLGTATSCSPRPSTTLPTRCDC